MSQEKEFYKNTRFPLALYPINYAIANFVLEQKPVAIFEFGCHDGRNLALMMSMNHNLHCFGLDINADAITFGLQRWPFLNFKNGDESRLAEYSDNSIDVVFTNSVLCHIKEPLQTIKELVRIAKRGVLCVETQEIKNQYYFAHDYRSFGFRKFKSMQSVGQPLGNGAVYDFWWLQK